ncbi:hypothetical protein ACFQZ2_00685 [Streptomonospora algeriensis]|uniref:Major facilitator superfamily (MFS) profile domain-containing protein n=1 Tax=Streptomonospora algeriensis TaxID=995084 RepID=A0ABW3B9J6_9ACTN
MAAALAVYGFPGWGFNPPMNTRALRLAGDAGTEAVALNTSGLCVGIAVAGVLGGSAVALHGGTGAAVAAAAIGLVALGAMGVSVRLFPALPGIPTRCPTAEAAVPVVMATSIDAAGTGADLVGCRVRGRRRKETPIVLGEPGESCGGGHRTALRALGKRGAPRVLNVFWIARRVDRGGEISRDHRRTTIVHCSTRGKERPRGESDRGREASWRRITRVRH